MSLIEKIDVPKHFAARSALRRPGVQFASQPRAKIISETKTADTESNAHGFIEDFSLEHSSSSAHVPPSK